MGSKFLDFLNFDAVDLDRQKDKIVPLHINATLFTLACAVSEPHVRLLIQKMKPKQVRYIFFVSNQHACTFQQDLCIHSEHLIPYLNAIGQKTQPSHRQVQYPLDAREWMWHIRHQFELPKFECKSNIIIIALIAYMNARIIRLSELGRLLWVGFPYTSKNFRLLVFHSMTGEDCSSTPFFVAVAYISAQLAKLTCQTMPFPQMLRRRAHLLLLGKVHVMKRQILQLVNKQCSPLAAHLLTCTTKLFHHPCDYLQVSIPFGNANQPTSSLMLMTLSTTMSHLISGELLALITTILASADLPASIPVYSDCMSDAHTALAAQRKQERPPITRRYGPTRLPSTDRSLTQSMQQAAA